MRVQKSLVSVGSAVSLATRTRMRTYLPQLDQQMKRGKGGGTKKAGTRFRSLYYFRDAEEDKARRSHFEEKSLRVVPWRWEDSK